MSENNKEVKTVNEKNTVPITDVNETPDAIIAYLQDYCHKHGYYIAKIEIVAL
jgi:hypothetical protein